MGVMIFGFLPSAVAVMPWQPQPRCRCYRPIEDWAENNYNIPRGYGDPATNNIMFWDWWIGYEYAGFIYEQLLPNGDLKISVHLEMFGIYVEGVKWGTGQWIFWGYGDFVYEETFILYREIPGGYIEAWDMYIEPGIRECGASIPFIFLIFFFPEIIGGESIFSEIKGTAYGEGFFGEYDDDDNEIWVPAMGYVHQVAIIMFGYEIWPVEDIIYTPL